MKTPTAVLFFFVLLMSCESTPPEPNLGASNITKLPKVEVEEKPAAILPFVSEKGRFSIQFPGTPTEDVHTTSAEIGEIKLIQFIYEKEKTQAWLVSYSDYPQKMIDLGNNAQLIKGIKHNILKNLRASPSIEKKIMLDEEYQGLEFSAYSKKDKLDILYKIYLVNNRVYQISMYSSIGPFAAQDSLDFMGSFKLLEAAAEEEIEEEEEVSS